MHRGCGDLQISGTDAGLIRQQLAGSPPECLEGAPSLEPARETAKERGGRTASVRNVLSGSGAGGITFWGGDLDFVSANVPKAGGSARGLPKTDDGAEGKAVEGRDLEKLSSGKGAQRSSNPEPGGIH